MKTIHIPYLFLFFVLFIINPTDGLAVIAYPYPIETNQPDGSAVTIRLYGDEFFHYITDISGNVIVRHDDGFLMYATINKEGTLCSSSIKASHTALRNADDQLLHHDSTEFTESIKNPALQRSLEQKIIRKENTSLLKSSTVITGDMKGLVILANFANNGFSVSNPSTAFQDLLNQPGYSANSGTGSARDFFMENSNQQFRPQFDVFGPVQLPQEMAYYGANDPKTGEDVRAEQMIIDACLTAKQQYPQLNFSEYDQNKDGTLDFVFVFYAGYNEAEGGNANTIWPHQFSVRNMNVKIDNVWLADYACTSELRGNRGTNMAGIGTFTHEFSHVLGLPDLYDADYEENGQGTGLGNWNIMASGPYLNNGRTPPYYGAMERSLLGWMNFTVLTLKNFTQSIQLPTIPSNTAYQINTRTKDEYFLLEARQKKGWDAYLPGEGMLVYHVDRTTTKDKTVTIGNNPYTFSARDLWDMGIPNITGNHPCMNLLRANNNDRVEAGNPYPGTNNITILSDQTTPGLVTWRGENTNVLITEIKRSNSDGLINFELGKTIIYPVIVETNPVKRITGTSAYFFGLIHSEGDESVIEKGFCMGEDMNPTINDRVIQVVGNDWGAYSAPVYNLNVSTLYHFRSYVTTSDESTYYGNDIEFLTLPHTASLPYIEQFVDGWSPHWMVTDGNNDGSTWNFVPADLMSSSDIDFGVAIIKGNENTANDWLISPPIFIPQGNNDITLSFYVVYFSDEMLELKISNTYRDEEAFTTLNTCSFETIRDEGKGSKIDSISLNAYIGQTIFLAFVNRTTHGKEMWISNIEIKSTPSGTDPISPFIYLDNQRIYFKQITPGTQLEIFGANGRKYVNRILTGEDSELIPTPGFYIVRLNDGQQKKSFKIIGR